MAGASAAATQELPDLVARVIAAAVFLKDEYVDRMVIERLVADGGYNGEGRTMATTTAAAAANGGVGSTDGGVQRNDDGGGAAVTVSSTNSSDDHATAPVWRWVPGRGVTTITPNATAANGSPTNGNDSISRNNPNNTAATGSVNEAGWLLSQRFAAEEKRYDRAAVLTARQIAASRLRTQSDSPAFDAAMMAVIEALLAGALDRHGNATTRNKSIGIGGGGASGSPVASPIGYPRGGGGGGAGRAQQRRLTAEELLAAEEAFSSNVLFIKRSTRYYCARTNELMTGSTSTEGTNAFPVALPNGMVIAEKAIGDYLHTMTSSDGRRRKTGVVIPPSNAFFDTTELKRIFVT